MSKRAGELTNEEIVKVKTIIANPRQFNLPDWFLGITYRSGSKRVRIQVKPDVVRLKYGKIAVRILPAAYEKLRLLYRMHNDESEFDHNAENDAIFCCALRYSTASLGGGFQGAIHEEVFDALREDFGCRMEIFASPFNCYYPLFFSAFPDVDAPFGSVGSVFGKKTDLRKLLSKGGSFEVNPPFDSQLIENTIVKLDQALKKVKAPLSFCVIVPRKEEEKGWVKLMGSKFRTKRVVLRQADHGYIDGKSQKREARYRVASFDTSVVFLQNANGAKKWPASKHKLVKLREAFKSRQKLNVSKRMN